MILFIPTWFSIHINAQSTWQQQKPQGNNLSAVSFATLKKGWCIGENGTILYITKKNSSVSINNASQPNLGSSIYPNPMFDFAYIKYNVVSHQQQMVLDKLYRVDMLVCNIKCLC